MKDDKALRPEIFKVSDFIKQEETVNELLEEELLLFQGKQTAFWKTLKEHFDNQIRELEQIQDNAIAGGASREQIGENAIVISLTRGILRKIIDRVEDSRGKEDGK